MGNDLYVNDSRLAQTYSESYFAFTCTDSAPIVFATSISTIKHDLYLYPCTLSELCITGGELGDDAAVCDRRFPCKTLAYACSKGNQTNVVLLGLEVVESAYVFVGTSILTLTGEEKDVVLCYGNAIDPTPSPFLVVSSGRLSIVHLTMYLSSSGCFVAMSGAGHVLLDDVCIQSNRNSRSAYSFLDIQYGTAKLQSVEVKNSHLGGDSFISIKNNGTLYIVDSSVHDCDITSSSSLFLDCDSSIENEASSIMIVNSLFEMLTSSGIYGGIMHIRASFSTSITIESCDFYRISVAAQQTEGICSCVYFMACICPQCHNLFLPFLLHFPVQVESYT
jgi:hypothetical protein